QTAIDANTRSKIYFGLGGHDAAAVARRTPRLKQADFQLLAPYSTYVNLMQDGKSSDWFSAKTCRLDGPSRTAASSISLPMLATASALKRQNNRSSISSDRLRPLRTSSWGACRGTSQRDPRQKRLRSRLPFHRQSPSRQGSGGSAQPKSSTQPRRTISHDT